jgi:hypothetical protein
MEMDRLDSYATDGTTVALQFSKVSNLSNTAVEVLFTTRESELLRALS